MTLEKGKGYGLESAQQTLQDKARQRLNNPTPHQAPQRERVSRAAIPSSARSARRVGARPWKQLIRPDVNLGVPTLMMILEPNVVWEHTQAFVPAVGKEVEASVTPGEFFDGWHKGGRKAHGVYEGSYWELIGDCEELSEILRKLSKAPALVEEPPLELPPPPELPRWDDFKPNLHVIPAAPSLPPLKLPPFRAPILETEVPFLEPEYLPLPNVPQVPKEEPAPIFIPPEFLKLDPLQEPQYVAPPPPVLPEAPRAPAFGQPKHGHDWTGERPFQLELPDHDAAIRAAAAKRIIDTSRWAHPPAGLPMLPDLDLLESEDLLKGIELEPIPKLELAWLGGPEPDPPFASMPAAPSALSRHSSRAASRAPSRPVSALPRGSGAAVPSLLTAGSRPRSSAATPASAAAPVASTSGAAAQQPQPQPAQQPAQQASQQAAQHSSPRTSRHPSPQHSQPQQQRSSTPPGSVTPLSDPSDAPSPAELAEQTPALPQVRPSSSRRSAGPQASGSKAPLVSQRTPEEQAWDDARSIPSEASGTPRVWLNFAAPFAELPPIMLPPQPQPGPEPRPEDFPHEPLEELPDFVQPVLLEAPAFVEPPQPVPRWSPPCEPGPIGFLRGTAPVIICDVSGTMHPRQQGRFRDLKRCAVELLDPEGELGTTAVGFDVITFCNGAWSWSAGYGERMGLLQTSQLLYSGRQVGGRYSMKTPPSHAGNSRSASPQRGGGSAGGAWSEGGATGRGLSLQPTQPELLADAQRWVATWPDAVGQTCMLSAFQLADQLQGADSWYILSDGLAHDQTACMDFLASRTEAGKPLPVIHAVGFISAEASLDLPGERFLRGLAELTGGSYQRYTPEIAKVWQTGKGFVRYNLRNELPEQMAERQWAERQLRAERRKNSRLGIAEPLDVTMERVALMHDQMRVQPAIRANEVALVEARRRHAAAVEALRQANERAAMEAEAAYEAGVGDARSRNQMRVDAARQAFLQAHADWEADYLARLQEWEENKAMLERQREEQLAAMRAAGQASRPQSSPPRQRPTSASLYGRPKSAAVIALSPRLVPSDMRAAFAAADYDQTIGLDQLSEKLSPSATPPGSRPMSGVPLRLASSVSGRAPPSASASTTSVRPRSAKPSAVAEDTEYLESIAEDRAETPAQLDSVLAGGRSAANAAELEAALDDDTLDVQPSARKAGPLGNRDQDSAHSSRRSMRRPSAHAQGQDRPLSGRANASSGSAMHASHGLSGGASAMRVASAGGSAVLLPEGSRVPPLPERSTVPPLPEPSAPLAPLRGESSEDFKRRLLPPDVVNEHDAKNTARLDEIRARWEAIIGADLAAGGTRKLATMQRNAQRVQEYKTAVYNAYAEGVVRDIVFGSAVRKAMNLALADEAEAQFQAELERVLAENERLRQLHSTEVDERRAKELAHEQACARWQEAHDTAMEEHEADKIRARAEHDANLEQMRAEWAAKKQEVDDLNAARLAEAEAMHTALVEGVKEANKQHKAEHTEMLRQRKEIEATNLSRLAEAKAAHRVRLEARAADNERLIKQATEEHQALCVRLSEEYEEARVQAESDHAELCAFLRTANEQLTEEARRRYQEVIAEVQAAHEADCVAVRDAHARDLERVRRFNQDIWPRVHVARLAQAELGRVQAFAEHIRFCANKFEMGVNLMPNTPNYDRVVEMQALTEALAKAFPDMPSDAMPWPDHERRLEAGTGWTAPPAPRQTTCRDPAEFITKIALGKVGAGSGPSTSSPRTASPRAAASPPAAAASATPAAHAAAASSPVADVLDAPAADEGGAARPAARPLSAGRARFANVMTADGAQGAVRPMSALPGSAAIPREAWGSAAGVSALSSPGVSAGLRPASAAYNNPSALRRSNTMGLRASSPRGGGYVSASAAVAAAAAASAALPPRPATARPATAAPWQHQLPQQHSAPAPGLPARPRSAGPAPRPARVAVDLVPLQASMARARAQAGVHVLPSASLAGFTKEPPRLRYPEVDVPQSLAVAR